jgi:hypothetical protein
MQKTNVTTVMTIVNYDVYQPSSFVDETPNETPERHQTKHQKDTRKTRSNNDKKEKNGNNTYSDDFSEWWKAWGKGSKANAFKRWEEKRKAGYLPKLSDLMNISKQYHEYCIQNDRSLKDSEGWINGQFWEGKWFLDNQSQINPQLNLSEFV